MITDTLKEIAATRAKLAELEVTHAEGVQSELAALPAKYGFESAKAFIKAVKAAAGGRRGPNAKGKAKAGRTRATITDEMRDEVKKLAGDGKSGAEIAKTVGISIPSVQNIKKALGLVKKRKK